MGKQKSCKKDISYYVDCQNGNATLHKCEEKEHNFYPTIQACGELRYAFICRHAMRMQHVAKQLLQCMMEIIRIDNN